MGEADITIISCLPTCVQRDLYPAVPDSVVRAGNWRSFQFREPCCARHDWRISKFLLRLGYVECHRVADSSIFLSTKWATKPASSQIGQQLARRYYKIHEAARHAFHFRYADALCRKQLCDPRTEGDILSVGDEIDFSAPTFFETQTHAFYHIGNMRRGSEVVAAVEPDKVSGFRRRSELRQSRCIVAPPKRIEGASRLRPSHYRLPQCAAACFRCSRCSPLYHVKMSLKQLS